MIGSILAVVLAAAPAKEVEFTVTYPTKIVILLCDGKVQYVGKRPKSVPRAKLVHWRHFFQVHFDGKLPDHGVFNINGKPVKPTVTVVPQTIKKNAADVDVKSLDEAGFAVNFFGPGKATFRVAIGNWRQDVQVEVRQIPAWIGMEASELLERVGYPDKKYEISQQRGVEYWTWKKCPDYFLQVGGNPGAVTGLLHKSELGKDLLQRLDDDPAK